MTRLSRRDFLKAAGFGAVVISTSKAQKKKLGVLAGDTHNAWANHLDIADGTAVGVELATALVTSPSLEQYILAWRIAMLPLPRKLVWYN